MALINTIASMAVSEVDAFRRDPAPVREASLVAGLSSFGMGGFADPLGKLLQEVMLDGEVIHPAITHDRDVPRFHDPARVGSLRARMDAAYASAGPIDDDPNSLDGWIRSEFATALHVVRHAADHGECVVTAWEVIGGVRGIPLRVRVPGPEERRARHGIRSVSIRIGALLAAAFVALLALRRRRMRERAAMGSLPTD